MMVPDIPFSVLCEDVRQETSGRFLFLGVFNDGVAVRRLPVRFVKLCVASRWTCGDGAFRQKTRIVAPDGVTPVVEGRELDVRLSSPEATHTNVETFLGVAFREAGVHWVEISLDGQLRIRQPFAVRLAAPPPSGR